MAEGKDVAAEQDIVKVMERVVRRPLVATICDVLDGMIVKISLLALFCVSPVFGQQNFLVRVHTSVKEGSASGSGCVVAVHGDQCPIAGKTDWRRATIVTARHTLIGDHTPLVVYANNESAMTQVLYRGNETVAGDIAVLVAWCPPGVQAIEVGTTPKMGDFVKIIGLGGCSSFWPKQGAVRNIPGIVLNNDGYIMLDAIVISGDSGGGILCQGKLVGIVSGMIRTMTDEGVMWRASGPNLESLKTAVESARQISATKSIISSPEIVR